SMPNNRSSTLHTLLESLRGREVFYVYCGVSTGSVLDIHFTPIKPRPRALGNTFLSQLHRENMGTLSLFVECSWRLQAGNMIIAASGDVVGDVEDIFSAVRRLERMSVRNVILPALGQVLDLGILFPDGLQLSVFCDSGASARDNYTVFHE